MTDSRGSSEPSASGQEPIAINTQLHTCWIQGHQRTCPKPAFAGVCYVLTMRAATQGRAGLLRGDRPDVLLFCSSNTQKGHRQPRTSACRSCLLFYSMVPFAFCFVFVGMGSPHPQPGFAFCLAVLPAKVPAEVLSQAPAKGSHPPSLSLLPFPT